MTGSGGATRSVTRGTCTRGSARTSAARSLALAGVVLLATLPGSAGAVGILLPAGGVLPIHAAGSGGDSLCPSSGPIILGIEWNCVAELNLAVVILMLGAVGIAIFIYWDSDGAELPGVSLVIPLTEEDWAAVRKVLDERRGRGRAPQNGGNEVP